MCDDEVLSILFFFSPYEVQTRNTFENPITSIKLKDDCYYYVVV